MTKIEKIKTVINFWYLPYYTGKENDWQKFCNQPYTEQGALTCISFILASVEECDWSFLGD